jgi:proteasome assembly chaperone (PAC2) family protein
MEPFSITATVLSGVVYDIIKTSAILTLDNFKTKVKGWLIDDATAQKVVDEINQISDLEDYSEKGLSKKLEQNEQLVELLKTIKLDQSVKQVTQIHSGSGDNVAGNKHVTYKADH